MRGCNQWTYLYVWNGSTLLQHIWSDRRENGINSKGFAKNRRLLLWRTVNLVLNIHIGPTCALDRFKFYTILNSNYSPNYSKELNRTQEWEVGGSKSDQNLSPTLFSKCWIWTISNFYQLMKGICHFWLVIALLRSFKSVKNVYSRPILYQLYPTRLLNSIRTRIHQFIDQEKHVSCIGLSGVIFRSRKKT